MSQSVKFTITPMTPPPGEKLPWFRVNVIDPPLCWQQQGRPSRHEVMCRINRYHRDQQQPSSSAAAAQTTG